MIKTNQNFLNLSGGWTSDGQVLILLEYGFSNAPYKKVMSEEEKTSLKKELKTRIDKLTDEQLEAIAAGYDESVQVCGEILTALLFGSDEQKSGGYTGSW